MIRLSLERDPDRPLSVLALGAHSDDIEIGCGGTLIEILGRVRASVTWIVLSARGEREAEARRSAAMLLQAAATSRVEILDFEDCYFPYAGEALKRRFDAIGAEVTPDVIFTHARDDLHQDHRTVNELTWNTFRDHLIFEYEIPKWDGDLGTPNAFVELSADTADRKVGHLLDQFASQRAKRWFTEDLFRSLLRIRGMECNASSGLAEGFYVRKALLV
jgi:LmbE family N-acetylglucosaminyl deacetylase